MEGTALRPGSGRHPRSSDKEVDADSAELLNAGGDLRPVIEFLRENGRKAKRTGNACVVATFIVGAAILVAFLYFSQISAAQRAEKRKEILELAFRQQQSLAITIENPIEQILKSAGTDRQGLEEATHKLLEVLSSSQKQAWDPTLTGSPIDEITYEVTSSVIRIGAVLAGIFLIQIMVTFARYYYKIAEHMYMASALISLSGGKLSDLKTTAPLLMPSGIDFGKEPTSPAEKAFDGAMSAIKELSQKIPTH